MPELPEVETTVRGLQKNIRGLSIKDVWTDLNTKDKRKSDTIANPKFFKLFRQEIIGKKIISVKRRAKNILINLSNNKTVLIHMKMTGHLLYGRYVLKGKIWTPTEAGPLQDPFNKFLHVVFSFSNRNFLAFSDMRKFGKITLLETKTAHDTKHLNTIGPEPLLKSFDVRQFKARLATKPKGKIKTTLMDQSVIAGIGNIYSDEILWRANVHPESVVSTLLRQGPSGQEIKAMFKAMKETLARGIYFGGDSMSDYRNIHGLPGKFQLHHEAYRRTGKKCRKKGCNGIIKRKVINGRSAHFCDRHQKLFTE